MDDAGNDKPDFENATPIGGGGSNFEQKKSYTNDDIPENRRKVGQFIRGEISKHDLSIKKFLLDKRKSDERGIINRLIQGRKIIRAKEAKLLITLFGGTVDFWTTLENKILANPDIYVPMSNPPRETPPLGQEIMAKNATVFNEAAQLTSDQLLRTKLASEGHTVLGEGEGMVIISKDTSPEIAKMLIDAWLTDRNAQREVTSPVPT